MKGNQIQGNNLALSELWTTRKCKSCRRNFQSYLGELYCFRCPNKKKGVVHDQD